MYVKRCQSKKLSENAKHGSHKSPGVREISSARPSGWMFKVGQGPRVARYQHQLHRQSSNTHHMIYVRFAAIVAVPEKPQVEYVQHLIA